MGSGLAEIQNRQSLETLLAREEEVKRKAIIHKEVYSGPLIRFYSKAGIRCSSMHILSLANQLNVQTFIECSNIITYGIDKFLGIFHLVISYHYLNNYTDPTAG